ncbi:MAG: type II secretion system minor pseudopilin GspJ [Sphingomonas sp.]|nr:type II secretion system minor pseudopilin GspJ [Sphingomonas sp.]
MSQRRNATQQGFTLVEVMISLLIFGLLAAGGVAVLSFSVRAQGVTQAKFDDIAALSRLNAILSADLAQARLRATRNEQGTPLLPFEGTSGSTGDPMLALVRGGWTNLDEAPRPDVQKVEYRLRGSAIERIAYPLLDGADPLPPAMMLTGVDQVALRYRLNGAWSDRWQSKPEAPLPEALEMQIVRRDGRRYRLVALVGTGYAPPPQGPNNGQ